MLVAAFDWTVVITAITTFAAAAIGYLAGASTARIQAKAQLDLLTSERAEAQRQTRSRVYVDFLDAANGILTLTQRTETITRERFYTWLDAYAKCYNALLLLGVKEVSRHITTFGPIRRDLFEDLSRSSPAPHDEAAFDELVRKRVEASEERRRSEIHKLVNFMRADVAPGGEPIYDVPAISQAV